MIRASLVAFALFTVLSPRPCAAQFAVRPNRQDQLSFRSPPNSQSSLLADDEPPAESDNAMELVEPQAPAQAAEIPSRPPEPVIPSWGPLDRRTPPIQFPSYDYEMVGPPRGVFQNGYNQIFRRPVADPGSLIYDDVRTNQPIDLFRPDGLAPAGVIGDHTLKSSQFLISYRFFQTAFEGNLSGTHSVSQQAILAQYPFAPTRMLRQTHMVLFEYAPTDDLTMLINLPFYQYSLNYVTSAGSPYNNSNTQIGDIKVMAMYALRRWNRQQIHLNFGLNIPVGLIDTLSNPFNPALPNLSYPMRPTSTTYDLLPGITYRGQNDRWTWGGQALGTVRMGTGRYHYSLGDQLEMTGWISRRLSERWSASTRLDGTIIAPGHGADPNINPALSPTNVLNLQAGKRLDLLFGVNFYLPDRRLPGQRISVESGFPIYQSLHGPQLRATWLLNASWNMIW